MSRSASDPSLIIAGQDTGGIWWSDDDGLTWSKAPTRAARLRDAGRAGRPRGPEPLVWRRRGAVPDRRQRRLALRRHLPLDRQGRALEAGLLASRPRTTSGSPRRSSGTRAPAARAGRSTRRSPAGTAAPSSCARPTAARAWAVRSTIPAAASGANVKGRVNSIWHHPSQSGRAVPLHAGRPLQVDGRRRDLDPDERRRRPCRSARWCGSTSTRRTATKSTASSTSRRLGTSGTSASLGLWRTTNGSAWTQIAMPSGFRASKVYVGFADGGGWQPVGSRTLYLIGRGQQMQVSHERRRELGEARASRRSPGGPRSGTSRSRTRAPRRPARRSPRRCLPHPTIARRALSHAKSPQFPHRRRRLDWRYSGEGFSGEIAFVGASSASPSRRPAPHGLRGDRLPATGSPRTAAGASMSAGSRGYTEDDVHAEAQLPLDRDPPDRPDPDHRQLRLPSAGARRRGCSGRTCTSRAATSTTPSDPQRARRAARGRASGTSRQADLLPALEPRHADRRLREQRPVARQRR